MLKNKFVSSVIKKEEDFILSDLQDKHKRFQSEYENMAKNQEIFVDQSEK